MYQLGELVVYGVHGVCRIAAEEEKTIDRKRVVYLVLEPVSQSGSRFLVPTHNTAAMGKLRGLLTGEALDALLCSEETRQEFWIPEESRRKQTYREVISSADPKRVAAMVCTLYRHRSRQQAAGKKVHQSDDNFLRDGEKLLIGEAAIAFGWEPEQAKTYIRNRLQEDVR